MRLSDLSKMTIVGKGGLELGKVKSIVVDVEEGKVVKFSSSNNQLIAFKDVKEISDKIFV